MGPNKERCGDCLCWEPTKGNFGFCRANAPSPEILKGTENDQFTLVVPSLGRDDWCRKDFEPAEGSSTSPSGPTTSSRSTSPRRK